MVKNTQKPKTATIPSWTGRLRATTARTNGQQAKAAASTLNVKPASSHRVGTKGGQSRQARASPVGHPLNRAKHSQHDRMTAKKAAKASKQALSRQRESDELRAKRQSANAARTSRARSEETEAVTVARRSLDAARTSRARSRETEAATAVRRSLNAAQTSRARSAETETARAVRKSLNAARTSRARSQEPVDAKLRRKASNAAHMTLARDEETAEVSANRKSADRERHAAPARYAGTLGEARRDSHVQQHYLGTMSLQCPSCHALHFKEELPRSEQFNTCCRHGLVTLPMFDDFPQELRDLFVGSTPEAVEFRKNLRSYNNSLAMGCMKAHLDVPRGGPYSFRIHGQVYHLIGPLHPEDGQQHLFAQVFILDTEDAAEELANRKVNHMCSKELFKHLMDILYQYNPFVKSFKMMHEKEEEEEVMAKAENREVRDVKMVFRQKKSLDLKRYQLPTANEVAVVFVGDEDGIPGRREITVYQRSNGKLQNLLDIDKETDPLCYPLLFVDGRYGWHLGSKRKDENGDEVKMSTREFYSYYLHVRPQFNPLHHAGKLFQQYCVDVWTKIEQERLNFVRQKQAQLRVESVQGLMEHVNGEEGGQCGKRVFLPSSFSGSPRDMVAQFQDALAVVSKYGKPDLFITLTCNPKWPEIKEALSPGQVAIDRPDIVARVFKLKIDEIKKDVNVKKIFGEVAAWVFVVEFQKRGLPHIHMLIILKDKWKLKTAADIDAIICAELPDKDEDPELYEIVSTMMIHRPCGPLNPEAQCMVNGQCSKHFLKDFCEVTSIGPDGFTRYRRRNDGRTVRCKLPNGQFVDLDNRSVVPYNKYLSRKYNCHVNVEKCGHVGAAKYLYKYVYKGHTRAAVHIFTDKAGIQHREENEIDSYLDTRYVCAPEALHHIFGFKMSERSIPVMQLKVHLKDCQGVVFKSGEEKKAMEEGLMRKTTLTAWFEANQKCADELYNTGMIPAKMVDTRGIHYKDMPEHFKFSKGEWVPRGRATKCIGRLHFVTPRDQERFALRLLLLNIADATSYEHLQTINGHEYKTCVEAAKAAGYLTDDSFYEKSLEEAATFNTAPQLRSFFLTLLMFGEVHNAEELWNKFRDDFCEDFIHQNYPQRMAETLAYNDLIDRMHVMGENLEKWMKLDYDRVDRQEVIDHEYFRLEGQKMREMLSPEQEVVVQAALEALENGGGLIYVDGPGGSGKTFAYTCLIYILLGMRKNVAALAWIGIAASLLPNGRTVASYLHLNIKDGCKTSSLNARSADGKKIAALDVLIWDEAPMSPKASLETADEVIQDVTQITKPFGGKVIILGGDFRQCLPVIRKSGVEEQIANSIKNSKLWPLFKIYKLTSNKRVTDGNEEWKKYLLEVGDGIQGEGPSGIMEVPSELRSGGDLAEEMFGSLLRSHADVADISRVAILAPTNQGALEMNEKIFAMIPGEYRVYESIDEVGEREDGPSDATNFPTEHLNHLSQPGLPPHKLKLKVGAIVMLIRNLDVKNGLCNGTRMVVRFMGDRVLQCAFISGPRKGEEVLLPKITLSDDTGIPFLLKRKQFPIRPACSMTINKAQGQTFDKIGLLLEYPIFSHGQLYVALSRTRTKEGIRIATADNTMNNIVCKSIL